jgi:hypothetical protein
MKSGGYGAKDPVLRTFLPELVQSRQKHLAIEQPQSTACIAMAIGSPAPT